MTHQGSERCRNGGRERSLPAVDRSKLKVVQYDDRSK